MRRLIDDLLSLTRIEQNEHVPPSGAVSLEAVLREAVAALTPLAQRRRHHDGDRCRRQTCRPRSASATS